MNFINLLNLLSGTLNNFLYTGFKNLSPVFERGKFIPSAAVLMLCFSCSILTGSIKTSRESEDNTEALLKEKGIYLNSVIVDKRFGSDAVRENAQYALELLINNINIEGYKTDVVLKEESFLKGFEQLNTVSLELRVQSENDNPLISVLISEETENTLSSYRYLYRILEKGIRKAGL